MEKKDFSEALAKKLRPLYVNLFKEVASFKNNTMFAVQCGSKFPTEAHEGLLMVGRATNGWIEPKDVDDLLDYSFKNVEPMKWVNDDAGRKAGYNPRRSAFWRIVAGIGKSFYSDEWFSYIAWSNLCKVAPQAGNPGDPLYYAQLKTCQKIFETEIEVLHPKAVILFTGYNWAKDFLTYLNGGVQPENEESWSKYECKVFLIKKIYYVLTEHPQGKKENRRKQTLIELLRKLA